ncbi:hypothetical protein B0H12DRAFT_1104191 [Mycena haematopus]|nr:hypothetical protein B0H12DRAFT_1104191 [Mycena haematopus]
MEAQIQDLLWSDDFAVLLGLKQSIYSDRNLPEGREHERHQRLLLYLRRNAQETQSQQDVIWSRFCALYLPATIDRILNLPIPTDEITTTDQQGMILDFSVHNSWHEMLVAVQHMPYLAKYLRSRKPIAAAGKQLPQLLADRLFDVSARWEKKMTAPARTSDAKERREYYVAAAGNAVQLLSTLCTHFINETSAVISDETQKKLLPVLTAWCRRYNGQFLGDVSIRMVGYMSKAANSDFNKVRKLYKNWDVCGFPLCNVRKNLKVCGKCQTVRYCSPDHQRMDWTAGSQHKSFCFRTEY